MPIQTTIRYATTDDLAFLDHLQRKYTHALGFLPYAAFLDYLARKQVFLAFENDEPVGYLLWQHPVYPWPHDLDRIVRIYQAAIAFDAQRQLHGTRLVQRLLRQVASASPTYITCWCAADLEANAFWKALDFHHYCTRDIRAAGRTTRTHNHWILEPPQVALASPTCHPRP